jgi:hypothetical protein
MARRGENLAHHTRMMSTFEIETYCGRSYVGKQVGKDNVETRTSRGQDLVLNVWKKCISNGRNWSRSICHCEATELCAT